MKNNWHESVMVDQVVDSLHITKGHKYIDATLGNGGYSIAIAKKGGVVLGIDWDLEMIELTKQRVGNDPNIKIVHGNFTNIDEIAKENGFDQVDGIVYDLGVSNIHLKSLTRGFSFENPESLLDMRIDQENQNVKASDLLNVLRPDHLEEMFKVILDGGSARWLTKKIVERRNLVPFKTVGDFLTACEGIKSKVGLNPATLPFLALRIAVNSELDNLEVSLKKAFKLLNKDGILAVVSFHSGEDRIVKKILNDKGDYTGPSVNEVNKNPRSRSARLRIFENK